MNAKIENEWIRCGKCGHKLCRKVGIWSMKMALPAIEIKCHSCKEINYIMIGKQRGECDDRIKQA